MKGKLMGAEHAPCTILATNKRWSVPVGNGLRIQNPMPTLPSGGSPWLVGKTSPSTAQNQQRRSKFVNYPGSTVSRRLIKSKDGGRGSSTLMPMND